LLILPGKAILIPRFIFVRHRAPPLVSIARDFFAATHQSWDGLEILPLCAVLNLVGTRFNTVRINGDGPEVGLDPRTNGVAHASVVHSERSRPIRSRCYYKWILGLRGLKARANSRVDPARCCRTRQLTQRHDRLKGTYAQMKRDAVLYPRVRRARLQLKIIRWDALCPRRLSGEKLRPYLRAALSADLMRLKTER
jgi:hypothetical protein